MTTFPGGIFGSISTPQVHASGPASVNDSAAKMPIGATFRWNNGVYRYVKHAAGTGTVTPSVGGPAWAKAFTPAATATAQPIFTVTADQTDSMFGNTPVGVYLSAPTDTYFCCIQVGGVAQCIVPAAIEEDTVIGSTSDNQFGRIAAGSNITRIPVGIRLEGASSSGLSPVLLLNMNW